MKKPPCCFYESQDDLPDEIVARIPEGSRFSLDDLDFIGYIPPEASYWNAVERFSNSYQSFVSEVELIGGGTLYYFNHA